VTVGDLNLPPVVVTTLTGVDWNANASVGVTRRKLAQRRRRVVTIIAAFFFSLSETDQSVQKEGLQ